MQLKADCSVGCRQWSVRRPSEDYAILTVDLQTGGKTIPFYHPLSRGANIKLNDSWSDVPAVGTSGILSDDRLNLKPLCAIILNLCICRWDNAEEPT